MTSTEQVLAETPRIIANLANAIRTSRRARLCRECATNPDRAVDQNCDGCAVEGDKEVPHA